MTYIYYKKKLINGKKRRIYKKKGSKNLYLKHKGRMVNVVKYKKYLKRKQKGGSLNFKQYTLAQRARDMHKNVVNQKNKIVDSRNNKILAVKQQNFKAMKKAPPSNSYMVNSLNKANTQRIKTIHDKKTQARLRKHSYTYGNY